MAARPRNAAFRADQAPSSLTSSTGSLATHMRSARASGFLRLADFSLPVFPSAICRLHEAENRQAEEKAWENVDLLSIAIHNCGLRSFEPCDFSLIHSVTSLSLAHNELSDLPCGLFMPGLKKLDLQHNRITTLSPLLVELVDLVDLNVSHNLLSSLPVGLERLARLEQMNAANNKLTHVPDGLAQLTNLCALNLAHNALTSVPPLGSLVRLRSLDLHHNRIASMGEHADGLERLTALAVCDLAENMLTALPLLPTRGCLSILSVSSNRLTDVGCACRVGALSTLNIKGNRITELPKEIGQLTQLKMLDVSNNDLSDLPGELGLLKELTRLLTDGNPLKKFPRAKLAAKISELKAYLVTQIAEPPVGAASSSVVDLPVSVSVMDSQRGLSAAVRQAAASRKFIYPGPGPAKQSARSRLGAAAVDGVQRLQSFPSSIFSAVPLLESLVLDGHAIDRLPAQIEQYKDTMNTISLNHNAFTSFPLECLSLPNLTDLSLRFNSIPNMPQQFGAALQRIERLDMGHNKLEEYPQGLATCGRLRILILSYNRLSSLPVDFPRLHPLLRELHMESCPIESLDSVRGWAAMSQLELINVANGELRSVPLEWALCSTLSTLMLAGNPQRLVSPAILSKGAPAIKEYLKLKMPIQ